MAQVNICVATISHSIDIAPCSYLNFFGCLDKKISNISTRKSGTNKPNKESGTRPEK